MSIQLFTETAASQLGTDVYYMALPTLQPVSDLVFQLLAALVTIGIAVGVVYFWMKHDWGKMAGVLIAAVPVAYVVWFPTSAVQQVKDLADMVF